jgi:hypothetical protein
MQFTKPFVHLFRCRPVRVHLWVETSRPFLNSLSQPLFPELLGRRFGNEAAASALAHEGIDAVH